MIFFSLLFSFSSALWPPESWQEPRVIRTTSWYFNNSVEWSEDYRNWSLPQTLELEKELKAQIEWKIGGQGIDIDILWFDEGLSENSIIGTAAYFSRFELTEENFHKYEEDLIAQMEENPESFPEHEDSDEFETEIATLLNPMWFEGEIYFIGNISCDIIDLQLDVNKILCQYLWSEKNEGCSTSNFERSDDYPDNHFFFQGEVKDLFHRKQSRIAAPNHDESFIGGVYPFDLASYFWDRQEFKNLTFNCITTENYPVLYKLEAGYDTVTMYEYIYFFIGAGVFLIAISWASFGCCFSQRCVRISSLIPILLIAALVTLSFLLWFNFDNEFQTFYMFPTSITLAVLLLIYAPCACCCLSGKRRKIVIKTAKSEKEKVGLSKL